MDESDSVPAVDIGLRTQEKAQLEEMVSYAVDYLQDIGLDEEADRLSDVTIEFENDHENLAFAYTAGTTPEEWRVLVSNLGKVYPEYSLKSWWLRKKLSARLRGVMEDG